MATTEARSKGVARIVRVALGGAVLAYGVYIADSGSPRLMIVGLTLFALPLVFQFLPWPIVRAYALWFGVFLVVQALITPAIDEDLPISRIPNRKVIRTYENESVLGVTGPQQITTDERGFRVTPQVDYTSKSGLRIFAIGASTTEESAIGDEGIWTHRLQETLASDLGRRVEVINTGMAGLRAQHHIATLRDILPLQPDIVLFLVGVNDWIHDAVLRFGRGPVGGSVGDRMRFSYTLLGRAVRLQFYRLYGSRDQPIVMYTAIPARPASLERPHKIDWRPDAASERYLGDLQEIGGICRTNRLICVFLTQPNAYDSDAPEELRDRFWMTPPAAAYTLTLDALIHVAGVYNRALIDFAKQSSHPVCDLAPRIAPTTEYFFDEVHFAAAGSARVAELVTECVKPLVVAVP